MPPFPGEAGFAGTNLHQRLTKSFSPAKALLLAREGAGKLAPEGGRPDAASVGASATLRQPDPICLENLVLFFLFNRLTREPRLAQSQFEIVSGGVAHGLAY